ncbi:uncharacterized protein LOC127009222 isoform X3 [Eriocheir sinensis]|uniref:uncharacterized protein LOC127009222 isoform X3 n=1 Tax=Eriocheir sinensis TaxID=95602 RepID=UPI0021CAC001|nr:uncharacterized protein LOC127009222 isoform X3 [Eriocheir sinensis]
MSVLWYMLSVTVVVLVPRGGAEESVPEEKNPAGKAAGGPDLDELLKARLSLLKAGEVNPMEELMKMMAQGKGAGGNPMLELMSKLPPMKPDEGNPMEELMKIMSQEKAAEGNPVLEFMSKLPPMKPGEGNPMELLMMKMAEEESSEENPLLEKIKKLSKRKAAEGSLPEKEVRELKKTYSRVRATQAFTLERMKSKSGQGSAAQTQALEKHIRNMEQTRAAQERAMEELLKDLHVTESLDNVPQDEGSDEINEGNPMESLMEMMAQGKGAGVNPMLELMSKLPPMKPGEGNPMEELMKIMSQEKAAEGNPVLEFMSKLPPMKPGEGNPMELLMMKMAEETTEENPLLEKINKLSLRKAAEGGLPEKEVRELKKTYSRVRATQAFTLERMKSKSGQGSAAQTQALEKHISNMEQTRAAQERAMEELLKDLHVTESLDNVPQDERNDEINEGNPLESLMKVMAQGKGAGVNPMLELMSKLPPIKPNEGNPVESLMKKMAQEKGAGGDVTSMLELMSKLPPMKPGEGNPMELLMMKMAEEESSEENPLLKLINKLSLRKAAEGGLPEKEVKELKKTYSRVRATQAFTLERMKSKSGQGSAAQTQALEKHIRNMEQTRAAQERAMEELLKDLHVTESLDKVPQDERNDEINEGNPMESLMKMMAQGKGAGGNPMLELMSKLPPMKPGEGNPMELLMMKMAEKESSEENPLLKLINKLSLRKAAAGGLPEKEVKELKKTYSRVRATQAFTLERMKSKSGQGSAAQTQALEKHIRNMEQTRAAQERAMEELLKDLPVTESLDNVSQDEGSDEINEKLAELPYQNYDFSTNYMNLVVAAKGWKDHSLREVVVPLVYKASVLSCFLETKNRSVVLETILGTPIGSIEDNKGFFDPCDKTNLKHAGLATCSVTKGLLHGVGVAAATAGHLSEAYVRTVLLADREVFKNFNNELFSVITESLSTNLVMLKHVFKMAVNFKDAVLARYFEGPFPVSGTETEFVKASDQLYAAIADMVLISKITAEHMKTALNIEKRTEFQKVAREFQDSYRYVVKRGIPEEYNNSPFPSLSYYWDMAALHYAVSLLSDIEGLAERTLQEHEDGTEGLIIDMKSLSKAVTLVHDILTITSNKVKHDELQVALGLATGRIRLVVSHLEEAGVELMKDEGSETLSELFESLLDSIIPTRSVLPHWFTPYVPARKPSLRMFAALIPTNYNQAMKMAHKLAAVIAGDPGKLGLPLERIAALFTGRRESMKQRDLSDLTALPRMLRALRDKTAMSVFGGVMMNSEHEFEEGDVDRCLKNQKCKQTLLTALVHTSMIINDREVHREFQKTLSNPFKDLSFDESMAAAGLPFKAARY